MLWTSKQSEQKKKKRSADEALPVTKWKSTSQIFCENILIVFIQF